MHHTSQFPPQLWDQLLPQAQNSLNELQNYWHDTITLAHESLEVDHDFQYTL